MSDFDPNSIPAILPQTQTIIDQKGRSTKPFSDWLFSLWKWFQNTAINLDTRVTTVQSQTDDNTAKVTETIQALTDGTGAYGSYILSIDTTASDADAKAENLIVAVSGAGGAYGAHIQTVTAQAAGISANGEIALVAAAAPSGYAASYTVHLSAGNAYGAFSLLADGAGGSALVVTANKFMMTDPSYNGGLPGNVFAYYGGVFRFNVPVAFGAGQIDSEAVSRGASAAGTGSVDITFWVNNGDRVVLHGMYDGDAGAYNSVAQFTVDLVFVNSGAVLKAVKMSSSPNGTGTSTVTTYNPTPNMFQFVYSGTSANLTFRIRVTNVIGPDPGISKGLFISGQSFTR